MNGGTSRLRSLGSKDLLSQLPMLQHLLQRLVDCKPSGQALHDPVVQVPAGCLALLPPCVHCVVLGVLGAQACVLCMEEASRPCCCQEG